MTHDKRGGLSAAQHSTAQYITARDSRQRTDGRDGRDDLAKLELVEDCGLPCGVKTDHQDPHLLLAEEALRVRTQRGRTGG